MYFGNVLRCRHIVQPTPRTKECLVSGTAFAANIVSGFVRRRVVGRKFLQISNMFLHFENTQVSKVVFWWLQTPWYMTCLKLWLWLMIVYACVWLRERTQSVWSPRILHQLYPLGDRTLHSNPHHFHHFSLMYAFPLSTTKYWSRFCSCWMISLRCILLELASLSNVSSFRNPFFASGDMNTWQW